MLICFMQFENENGVIPCSINEQSTICYAVTVLGHNHTCDRRQNVYYFLMIHGLHSKK